MKTKRDIYVIPLTAEVKALIERYNSLEPMDNACFDMKWWVEFAKELNNKI